MWLGNFTLVAGLLQSLSDMIPDIPVPFGDNKISNINYINSVDNLNRIKRRNAAESGRFPDDFLLGVSTSAFQTEGAWNVSDKSESIWDRLTHLQSDNIADRSNADIASNSYYLYKTDIDLVQQLGANAYRISLSWPRILPNGFSNKISQSGIDYYNNVINEMLSKNITPFVTIFHWDLPQKLQDLGGFSNPKIIDYYTDYAKVVFNAFGDRVKNWITFNEPLIFCMFGYGTIFAPLIKQSGVADYLCSHNLLIAHAKTHKMYHEHFYRKQEGKVGITLSLTWPIPENDKDPYEVAGAERFFQFHNGWFLNPIFSDEGDYPDVMKQIVSDNSKVQGFSRSRLPEFTQDEINLIKNSSDFLGVNYYYATWTKTWKFDIKNNISYTSDLGVIDVTSHRNSPVFSDRCAPWAMVKIIKRVNKEYNIPMFYITENGYYDEGQLADTGRAIYFHKHLSEIPKMIAEGVDIRGYFAWSLLDNFEWTMGYTQRYGIYSVNFTHPNLMRTPKTSAIVISEIYKTRRVLDSLPIFD